MCHNALFDVGWLYASGVDVASTQWLDTMLMCKWVENGQRAKMFEYSLVECCKRHLQEWRLLPEFVALKASPAVQSNDAYWQTRCRLDVIATALLADKLLRRLTPTQRKSMAIEAGNIVPNAKAWVDGLPTDPRYYKEPIPDILEEMGRIEGRIGVPNTVLSSPTQLTNLLYNTWGLKCERRTPKDKPSSDKAALTYLAEKDDRCLDILEWRSLNTLLKLCRSPAKANGYLGSSVLHPSPNIFGTYTGRYTYSSKILKKYPVAFAVHQIPRGPKVRRCVVAPDGEVLVEFDASGQEARLIAEIGDVHEMLDVFRAGKKIHGVTGAALGGFEYDDFMCKYKAGDEAVCGAHGLYNAGKYTNLSNQYRVGAAKSRVIARIQYNIKVDVETVRQWQAIYHQTYPGIRRYWRKAEHRARMNGYAETLAGRRYQIHRWGDADKWKSASSAINFPIQGSGADMKNLAISMIAKKFPELRFAFDLHDGLYYWCKVDDKMQAMLREANHCLDNLNYLGAWGWQPRIPLPWECKVGANWGEMKEV